MSAVKPIEMARDEVERLVKPYPPEEILEILLKEKIISYYMTCREKYLIWPNSFRRLDAILFSLQLAESDQQSARVGKKK